MPCPGVAQGKAPAITGETHADRRLAAAAVGDVAQENGANARLVPSPEILLEKCVALMRACCLLATDLAERAAGAPAASQPVGKIPTKPSATRGYAGGLIPLALTRFGRGFPCRLLLAASIAASCAGDGPSQGGPRDVGGSDAHDVAPSDALDVAPADGPPDQRVSFSGIYCSVDPAESPFYRCSEAFPLVCVTTNQAARPDGGSAPLFICREPCVSPADCFGDNVCCPGRGAMGQPLSACAPRPFCDGVD
jgi:hypothetical protein